MADQVGDENPPDENHSALLERAIRLFKFLGRVQEMKAKTPRTIATYERDGDVIWYGRLPNHPANWCPQHHRANGSRPARSDVGPGSAHSSATSS